MLKCAVVLVYYESVGEVISFAELLYTTHGVCTGLLNILVGLLLCTTGWC